MCRIEALIDIRDVDENDARGQLQGRLQRIRQTRSNLVINDQTIHDDFDLMLLVLVERYWPIHFENLTVHADPKIPVPPNLFENFSVFSLPSPHDWSKYLYPGPGIQLKDRIHNLLDCLFLDPSPAIVAEGHADTGVQETEMVVDFGHRTHRRSGILRGCALFDGNSRREAFDRVHVRLFHQAQELSCIG